MAEGRRHSQLFNVRKCNECGQLLPEGFRPPADEPWTAGIFGCTEDTESCWTGLFCPCVLFGRNVEKMNDIQWTRPCVFHAVGIGGCIALAAATSVFAFVDPVISYNFCEVLLCSWWICGKYTGLIRKDLQKKYHLKKSPLCDPCMQHCYLHWCALCQEHREMKNRLSNNAAMRTTVVNPPPIQEMNS